jgi:hypothetical protein
VNIPKQTNMALMSMDQTIPLLLFPRMNAIVGATMSHNIAGDRTLPENKTPSHIPAVNPKAAMFAPITKDLDFLNTNNDKSNIGNIITLV